MCCAGALRLDSGHQYVGVRRELGMRLVTTGKPGPYERRAVFALDEVLPYAVPRVPGQLRPQGIFAGQSVWMDSARYLTFAAKGTTCVVCGLDGRYFALERDAGAQHRRYHLNLYGVAPDGREVLFTKDHVVPLARGGRDALENLQTLCKPCNEAKGSAG